MLDILSYLPQTGFGLLVTIIILLLKTKKHPIIGISVSVKDSTFKFAHSDALEVYGKLGKRWKMFLLTAKSYFYPIIIVGIHKKDHFYADMIIVSDIDVKSGDHNYNKSKYINVNNVSSINDFI